MREVRPLRGGRVTWGTPGSAPHVPLSQARQCETFHLPVCRARARSGIGTSKVIGFSPILLLYLVPLVSLFFFFFLLPLDSRALVNTMQKSRIVGLQSLGCLRSSVIPFNGAHWRRSGFCQPRKCCCWEKGYWNPQTKYYKQESNGRMFWSVISPDFRSGTTYW